MEGFSPANIETDAETYRDLIRLMMHTNWISSHGERVKFTTILKDSDTYQNVGMLITPFNKDAEHLLGDLRALKRSLETAFPLPHPKNKKLWWAMDTTHIEKTGTMIELYACYVPTGPSAVALGEGTG